MAPVVLLALAGCPGGTPAPDTGAGGGPAEPAASVTPQQGAVGTEVEVRGSGFPADTEVEIGFGPPNSEYSVVTTARTGARGTVEAAVRVPDWADAGRDYVWVVAGTDHRQKAVTDTFTVPEARRP